MNGFEALRRAGADLVAAGLSPGSSGNISVRVDDRLMISCTGAALGDLHRGDVAVLDLDGRELDGARPSKEWPLHVAFYRRSRGHGAVVHVHSPSAVALACVAPWAEHSAVPPLTPYFVMRVGQTPLLPYRPPGDPGLGDDLLAAPWEMNAALLANHGQVVAAAGVADAVERAVELEEACRVALATTGLPRRLLDADQVLELARRWSSPWTIPAVGSVPG